MLILPSEYKPKFYMPVPERQWRDPSQAVAKDMFGNPVVDTVFRIEAHLHDGFVRWRGLFKSRDDFDAFSWSLARYQVLGEMIPREEWNLPTPSWHPDIAPEAYYVANTLVFLTGSPGTNQTYTSPIDWDSTQNRISTLGAGGNGGAQKSNVTSDAGGGGGGAWNYYDNFVFTTPGTTTATYQVGAQGALQTLSGGATSYNGVTGNNGGSSWFGGTSLSAASVGSIGGYGGKHLTQDSFTNTRATASSGKGTGGFDGGNGSDGGGSGPCAGGGGGAAGPNGVGRDATALGSGVARGGANGDLDLGGAGSSTGNGAAGTEWGDSTHGSGGGGTGKINAAAGNGGNYGAGGGGVASNDGGTYNVGQGAIGLIMVSYKPRRQLGFNMPMMGM